MCRAEKDGGRQCPNHSPAGRRLKYAAEKLECLYESDPDTAIGGAPGVHDAETLADYDGPWSETPDAEADAPAEDEGDTKTWIHAMKLAARMITSGRALLAAVGITIHNAMRIASESIRAGGDTRRALKIADLRRDEQTWKKAEAALNQHLQKAAYTEAAVARIAKACRVGLWMRPGWRTRLRQLEAEADGILAEPDSTPEEKAAAKILRREARAVSRQLSSRKPGDRYAAIIKRQAAACERRRTSLDAVTRHARAGTRLTRRIEKLGTVIWPGE